MKMTSSDIKDTVVVKEYRTINDFVFCDKKIIFFIEARAKIITICLSVRV